MKGRAYTVVILAAALFIISVSSAPGQLTIRTIDVAGDSISKGFNAGSAFPCANADQENYNWLTSNTHGNFFCTAGSENVFSFAERLECDFGTNVFTANPNHAASGARMLSDFVNQANGIKTFLAGEPAPRLAAVFLGHNDNCSGTLTKSNTSCSSPDLDPGNYCRTKPGAFEREFRKGLEILMSVPNTRIGVVAPVRVSQLCNFGAKSNCQGAGNCQFLWGSVSICGSLTRDCSSTRIIDAYTTVKAYRDILMQVTAEYAAIPEGGNSRLVLIGGEMVGGATKAQGTTFLFTDGPWVYKFNADQLSCCDCFHPSATGQDALAKLMKNGLDCSRLQPCCKDTGDALTDGKCGRTETKRFYYRGLF